MDDSTSQFVKQLISSGVNEPSESLDRLTHAVIGAAIEVHRQLGPGLGEPLYEEAFCIELSLRKIPFKRQHKVPVNYKGRRIGKKKLDVLVGGRLMVELKAVERLAPVHSAQVISYLRLTGNQLGLLINFNVPVLKEGIKRVILSSH